MISPDSRWLITGGEQADSTQLWDLKSPDLSTAKPLRLPADLNTVAFGPDSHWLVTGEGQLRLWNLTAADPTAKPLDLTGHEFAVTEAVFSPDGRWLATSSVECFDNDGVRLWNLKTQDPAARPITLGHKGSIGALAFSPDNRWLITGSGRLENCPYDGTAMIWDLTAADIAAKPHTLGGHAGPIFATTFSPGSADVVTVSGRGFSVKNDFGENEFGEVILRARNGWVISIGRVPQSTSGSGVSFKPEETSTASCYAIRKMRLMRSSSAPTIAGFLPRSANRAVIWDLKSRRFDRERVLFGHEGELSAMAFSPDSRYLVTGGNDKTARLWKLVVGFRRRHAAAIRRSLKRGLSHCRAQPQ